MIRAGIRRVFQLALRRRDRWEAEVEDEIKLHLALRAEQLMSDGRDADAAYAEAIRRFGVLTESRARLIDAARHRERNMQRTEFFDDLRHDVAFALRTLRRQKAWTAVTITTLALGIAATTAVFSVVSTLLLHPLPYPHASRIVHVDQQPTEGNHTGISVTIASSAPVVRAWMKASHSFEALEASQFTTRMLKTTNGEPSRVSAALVLPSFPDFAGARPLRGRMFNAADIETRTPVVVLGESFWRNRLGSDEHVLGQRMTIGDTSYTVIGVMSSRLTFGTENPDSRPIELWLPLDMRNDKQGMRVIGRLRPGITRASAASEIDSIFARTSGFTYGNIPFRSVVSAPGQRVRFHDSLILLAGAVGLVLLVACANVAHLLLVRSATRQRELAVRAALGAGRGRILRQLLTESLLLTFAGTGLGVIGGWLGLHVLIALRPRALDVLQNAHLDLTTLTVAIIAAVVSGLAFTMIGAIQVGRHASPDALKNGASGVGVSRGGARTRSLLVTSEMALSAMLLVGATLLVRSVMRLQNADLGFDPRGLYAIGVPFLSANSHTPSVFDADATRAVALRDFIARLRTMPNVRGVTTANVSAGSRWFSVGRLDIEGEAVAGNGSSSFIDVNTVQPNFFDVMGIHVESGTTFTDTSTTSLQVIVNSGFAAKHWPRGQAIGHRIRIAQSDSVPWRTIVGVVGNAQTSGPGGEVTAPIIYSPMSTVGGEPRVLVRIAGSPSALAPAIEVLKQLGVSRPMPPEGVEHTISYSLDGPRFVMTLLTVLTVLALLLAAVGLYGMMAYTVAQQTREIGIRVALGASGDRIARSVVGRGAALAIVGAAIGLAAAVWGTRLIETQLYGVTRLDPVSFGVGALVLVGSALLACIVPTRRALRIDPVTAIRAD